MWIECIHREIHTYIRVHSQIHTLASPIKCCMRLLTKMNVLFNFNIWTEYNQTLWIWQLNSHTRNLSAFDVNNLYEIWWDWNIHNKFWINLKCTLNYYQHLSWWRIQLNSMEKSSDFFLSNWFAFDMNIYVCMHLHSNVLDVPIFCCNCQFN